MSCWIVNSCRKSGLQNEKYCLDNNICMIGFGIPEEHRDKNSGNTTIKQFDKFKNNVNVNDTIYLYANKIGIIAKGKFLSFNKDIQDEHKAPDWSKDEKQIHINIDKWEKFENPNYKARPLTLYLEKKQSNK